MVQVASIDYPNKRIHLHFDTVANGVDPVEAYKEIRALRRTTEAHQRFSPLISAQGNEPKGQGRFTPRRAVLLDGARFVPYNTSHTLTILTEVITDDEQSGAGAFDRSPLSPGVDVDIDIGFDQVEIITVATGGALTSAQATQLDEVHRFRGLNGALPITGDQTGNTTTETDGTVTITHTVNPTDQTVVRQRSG
ncbi:MAG: hypothetical protein AAGA83_00305 [Cyanobacteria bacterium P01_F01_bin.116]